MDKILLEQDGQTKIFKHFAVERFSRGLNECPERVLGGSESAAESSLSDDESEADSRGAIKRLHSIPSIFHLIEESEWLNFSCFFVIIVSLNLGLGPCSEVHEDADGVSCATKIAEELVLLNVRDLFDGLAFHHDVPSVGFDHQIHLEIGLHFHTMENRMMLILPMSLETMFLETDLEGLLVEIFRHATAKVLVDSNHAGNIRITEVNQLFP